MTFLLPEFVLMGQPVEVSNYDLLVRVDSKENLEKLLSRARGQNEWWNMLGEDMVAPGPEQADPLRHQVGEKIQAAYCGRLQS